MQGTRREGRGGIGERRRGEEARMPGKERKVAELAMASAGGGGGGVDRTLTGRATEEPTREGNELKEWERRAKIQLNR